MAYHSGMQPTNRKENPFRPTGNSPSDGHFTLVDLLCIWCDYSIGKKKCKEQTQNPAFRCDREAGFFDV